MKLLVAVDGSEASHSALAHAGDIAAAMNGSLTVVHAVNPNVYDLGGSEPVVGFVDADSRLVAESMDDAEKRAQLVLEDAEARAHQLGHSVETEMLYGDPVKAISEFADDFDALFVGHRGLSRRTEQMVGSVAKSMVERAPIPVTVVR